MNRKSDMRFVVDEPEVMNRNSDFRFISCVKKNPSDL